MTLKEFELRHLIGKMTKRNLQQCLKLSNQKIKQWQEFKKQAIKQYEEKNK